MNRFPLSCALAAFLAGSLAAQFNSIDIIIPHNAWIVTPARSNQTNQFGFTSGTTTVGGGLQTMIGTSVSLPYRTKATAAFHGDIAGGPPLSGSLPTQTVAGTETYTYVAGGGSPNPVPFPTVTCDLNAYVHWASDVYRRGAGYSGVANANVTVSCPSYGLMAGCQALGVEPPAFPLITTVPQSGSVTRTGITNWWIAMSSTSDVSGAMTGPDAYLLLAAACVADGTVTLD